MKALDLFSGIGGFSLGLEQAGVETVAFCEVNPVCRHVLKHHWPKVPCYDDVQTLTGDRLRADGISVDVICGGFPCQDISNAGKMAGLEGERSGLWRHYFRLVCEIRPKYVVMENVSALISRGLGDILRDLASIGYDAWWDCVSASSIGADHQRDRIWLVAYPSSEGLERSKQKAAFFVAAIKECTKSCNDFDGARRSLEQNFEDICIDDGLHIKLERLRIQQMGNAVVPQIPEALGRAIMKAHEIA